MPGTAVSSAPDKNALNALEKELTAAQQRLTVLRQQSGENVELPMEEQQ